MKPVSKGDKYLNAIIFLIFLFLLGFVMVKHLPQVVFYCDQVKGKASIVKIHNDPYISYYNTIEIRYYHVEKEKYIDLYVEEENTKKLEMLKEGKEVNIIYSNYFPNLFAIKGYHRYPNPMGLLIILMASIPVIGFKSFQ